MAELQSNYTSIEQSNQLVELGVPVNSADCYIYTYDENTIYEMGILNKMKFTQRKEKQRFPHRMLPCWSAGRLMEIIAECYQVDLTFRYFTRGGMMESLINTFSDLRAEINFSVLEQYGVGQCTRENKS